ncbi:MAG: DUF3168 domain-containing protein [Dehalococcoidia bacterium]|jgi:hypothetical protein
MKDPGTQILSAFYTALNGHTTLTVYTMVPPNTAFNYIWIGDITNNEEGCKDRYISNATVAIDIVKGYVDQGSKKAVEDEAGTIAGHIRTAVGAGLTMTGFTMHVCVLDSTNDMVEETETQKIFHKILRYRMIIEET